MTTAHTPFYTMHGARLPAVRQLSVFLDNRVGQLLRLTQLFEDQDIRILGLCVDDSVDYAVVRLIFDYPDEALKILRSAGFVVSLNEILTVALPKGKNGLLTVWKCLLSCELNIGYCYPLLANRLGPIIALSVEDLRVASDILIRHKFEVLGEEGLRNI
jgi:hypothetical protein